jgi:HAD superfamily hydrolase (TIGR01509 family)
MTDMPNSRPGVIFDVDGVLVDSSVAHYHSWLALADESGGHRMSEAEFDATFGRTSREIIAELWPGGQLTAAEIARLDDRKEQLYRDLLRADFRAIAGAADLITALKDAGFAVAAGSSGPPENVFLVLDQLQRRDLFDAVITAADVTRGKPHPEVFLKSAGGLGLPPHQCAVIEDALVGVAAANDAGCLSIALVAPGRDVSRFTAAQHVVRDLSELSPDRIRRWLADRPSRG